MMVLTPQDPINVDATRLDRGSRFRAVNRHLPFCYTHNGNNGSRSELKRELASHPVTTIFISYHASTISQAPARSPSHPQAQDAASGRPAVERKLAATVGRGGTPRAGCRGGDALPGRGPRDGIFHLQLHARAPQHPRGDPVHGHRIGGGAPGDLPWQPLLGGCREPHARAGLRERRGGDGSAEEDVREHGLYWGAHRSCFSARHKSDLRPH